MSKTGVLKSTIVHLLVEKDHISLGKNVVEEHPLFPPARIKHNPLNVAPLRASNREHLIAVCGDMRHLQIFSVKWVWKTFTSESHSAAEDRMQRITIHLQLYPGCCHSMKRSPYVSPPCPSATTCIHMVRFQKD